MYNLCLSRWALFAGVRASYEMQGPSFVSEPLSRVEFTNVGGGRVECTVRGNPEPTVEWLVADGGSVASIPGIREVFGNGTIHFPAFEAEAFRQDVHWAIYKCSAINSVGAVVSRDVTVRAGNTRPTIRHSAAKFSAPSPSASTERRVSRFTLHAEIFPFQNQTPEINCRLNLPKLQRCQRRFEILCTGELD